MAGRRRVLPVGPAQAAVSVEFVSNSGLVGGAGGARPSLGNLKPGSGDGEFHDRPSALAVVPGPGLGLVVREVVLGPGTGS